MIVATAGHIDHGKTVLVKALTGVDTDRLPEEKRRGMTIDLGFAYDHLDDGKVLGFVDVPGHERFIRNMLAGVAAIDFALVVVAADDGLACLPCQAHLLEVQDSLPTISEQGAQVLVVAFDTVEQLEGYRSRLKLTFPVAADPERVAYEAYGLTQGSLLHIWHPKTLWRYVVLRLKGRKLQRPKKGDDLTQLGGDFVVNARGEVIFAHYSSRPDDRPEVAAIMDAVSTHSR